MIHIILLFFFSNISPLMSSTLHESSVSLQNILEWKYGGPFSVNLLSSKKVKTRTTGKEIPVHDQSDFTSIKVNLDEAEKIDNCVRNGMLPVGIYHVDKIYAKLIELPVICLIQTKYNKIVNWTSTKGFQEKVLTEGKYRPYFVKSRAGTEISDTIAKVTDPNGRSVIRVTLQNNMSTSFEISASYKQEEKSQVKTTISKSYTGSLSASLGVAFYSIEGEISKENSNAQSNGQTTTKTNVIKKTVSVAAKSLQMMKIKMSTTTTTEMIYQEAILSGYVAFNVMRGLDDGTEIWFMPISEYIKLFPTEFKVNKNDPIGAIIYLTAMRDNVKLSSQAHFTPYFNTTEINNVFNTADK